MKVFLVREPILRRKRGVSIFHTTMFHGLQAYDFFPVEYTGQLHLWKNIYNLAPLFSPPGSVVASDRASKAFRSLSGVVLRPVIFETVFSYPFDLGDYSFLKEFPEWSKWEWYDWYRQARFMSDANVERPDEPYYEILAPLKDDVQRKFPGRAFSGSLPLHGRGSSEHLKISVTDNWYNKCGIAGRNLPIIADWLFQSISLYVDRSYYQIVEGTLNGG